MLVVRRVGWVRLGWPDGVGMLFILGWWVVLVADD